MSNKKITDLTELTTPTTDDVFPIVDIATNTTQKVQVGNLPIQTAVTTALATKQATLVSGTNIKTINGASVLGSGDIVTPQPSGVAGAIQFSNGSTFASDATNLFWDDTNNRLGVGTNVPSTTVDILPPVQTAIATQFDCFRVGYSNSTIGVTNGSALQVQVATTGTGRYSTTLRLSGGSDTSLSYLKGFDSNTFGVMLNRAQSNLGLFSNNGIKLGDTAFAGSEGSASGMVHIQGSGSTSATTSLLVQNSVGAVALSVKDNLLSSFGGVISGLATTSNTPGIGYLADGNGYVVFRIDNSFVFNIDAYNGSSYYSAIKINNGANANILLTPTGTGSIGIGTTSPNTSCLVDITSTTKGFLPPRMTTTEKNAIASPAAGLVVYDSTTNKLCCYNGSTWNDLF